MNIGEIIFSGGGNILPFIAIIWMVINSKIDKNETIRTFIGVVLAYIFAIIFGAILLSLTRNFTLNPEKILSLTMFVSTVAEELMKCALYILLFKNIQRVTTVVFYGLIFGIVEVFLVGNSFSYGSMLIANLHSFLHPSFLLIMYYFASKGNFKDTKYICFGVYFAVVTHLLNNFLNEFCKVLYPFYFSALMYFSYSFLRSYYRRHCHKIR